MTAILFFFVGTGQASDLGLNSPANFHNPGSHTENHDHVLKKDATVYKKITDSIEAKTKEVPPKSYIAVGKIQFPVFSKCEKPFYRVATINPKIDGLISKYGWVSGHKRGLKGNAYLKKDGYSLEDRVLQYTGTKFENLDTGEITNNPRKFPANAEFVGIIQGMPGRTASVGYHTGWKAWEKDQSKYMRMDEIAIGKCSKNPVCQKIHAHPVEESFKKDAAKRKALGLKTKRIPRFSIEGEHVVEEMIPDSCVVASFRFVRQKFSDGCYSDSHGNCN